MNTTTAATTTTTAKPPRATAKRVASLEAQLAVANEVADNLRAAVSRRDNLITALEARLDRAEVEYKALRALYRAATAAPVAETIVVATQPVVTTFRGVEVTAVRRGNCVTKRWMPVPQGTPQGIAS